MSSRGPAKSNGHTGIDGERGSMEFMLSVLIDDDRLKLRQLVLASVYTIIKTAVLCLFMCLKMIEISTVLSIWDKVTKYLNAIKIAFENSITVNAQH